MIIIQTLQTSLKGGGGWFNVNGSTQMKEHAPVTKAPYQKYTTDI